MVRPEACSELQSDCKIGLGYGLAAGFFWVTIQLQGESWHAGRSVPALVRLQDSLGWQLGGEGGHSISTSRKYETQADARLASTH